MAESDAISLHMVLSPRSRGIIGAEDIGRMKEGAILINTSRGPLIDEGALVAAVRAGKIIAALDVYDKEPLPQDHPLRDVRRHGADAPSRIRSGRDLARFLPAERRERSRLPGRRANQDFERFLTLRDGTRALGGGGFGYAPVSDRRADRKGGRLLVHAVHLEPHEPSDAMDAIVEELAALADRLGHNRVVLPSKIA